MFVDRHILPHDMARKTSASAVTPVRFARRIRCRRTPRTRAVQRYGLTDAFPMSVLDPPVSVARGLRSAARGSGRRTDKAVRRAFLRPEVPVT